jgi:hypothetical protein
MRAWLIRLQKISPRPYSPWRELGYRFRSISRWWSLKLYYEKLQIPLNTPFPKGDFNTPL